MVLRNDYGFAYELYLPGRLRCSEMIMVLLMNILTRTVNRYIIRTMSAKHALLVRNQTLFITGFHAPPAHKMALSHSKHIL